MNASIEAKTLETATVSRLQNLIPQRSTADWRALDGQHHLHPFTDFGALAKEGGPRVVVRGEGVHIIDSEGKRILDGMSGLWCCMLGYGRKELAEVAYQQMLELPFYNTFFKTATPPSIQLAAKLAEVAPAHVSRVFFTGSGSEGNDTILRIVRHYWTVKGQPDKKVIISRLNGYHGSTVAGASLGGMTYMHAQGDLPIPGIVHIEQPYWYENGYDVSPAEYGIRAARRLAEKIEQVGPAKVAAFIAEPIQGAGGIVIPPETYWPEIQRICDHYGILLIADEVICGFGRTGKWFGSEYYGIKPDLMTIAKGLTSGYIPMGGVLVGDRVGDVLFNEGGEFEHGFTYSGHPVAAAVALENIRILQDEQIIEKCAANVAPYLQQKWQEAFADHPMVGECRGLGMFAAIVLMKDKAKHEFFPNGGEIGLKCREYCFANGLVMRAVGSTMIIAPPLVMTRENVDELVQKARLAVDLTARDLGFKV
jgi:putrescine---pyruvate transaminase